MYKVAKFFKVSRDIYTNASGGDEYDNIKLPCPCDKRLCPAMISIHRWILRLHRGEHQAPDRYTRAY